MSNGNGTYSRVRLLAGRNTFFCDGEITPVRKLPDYIVCGTRVFRLWEIADRVGRRSVYRECNAAPLLTPSNEAQSAERAA